MFGKKDLSAAWTKTLLAPAAVSVFARGALRTVIMHPATLLVVGLLAAYTASLLLLQGRVISLLIMCVAGLVVASIFTSNMTVVFVITLGAFYAYLLLIRHMRFSTVSSYAAKQEEGLENAADAAAGAADVNEPEAEAEPEEEEAAEPTATVAEQKLDVIQKRVDGIQKDLDTMRPAIAAGTA